jgi:hypothetical protein
MFLKYTVAACEMWTQELVDLDAGIVILGRFVTSKSRCLQETRGGSDVSNIEGVLGLLITGPLAAVGKQDDFAVET